MGGLGEGLLYTGGIFLFLSLFVSLFLSCVTRSLTSTTAVVMCVVTIFPSHMTPRRAFRAAGIRARSTTQRVDGLFLAAAHPYHLPSSPSSSASFSSLSIQNKGWRKKKKVPAALSRRRRRRTISETNGFYLSDYQRSR